MNPEISDRVSLRRAAEAAVAEAAATGNWPSGILPFEISDDDREALVRWTRGVVAELRGAGLSDDAFKAVVLNEVPHLLHVHTVCRIPREGELTLGTVGPITFALDPVKFNYDLAMIAQERRSGA